MKRFLMIIFIGLIVAGCGNTGEDDNETKGEEDEAVMFRLIDIVVEEDQVKVTGDVNSWDGNFYYHILDGEEIIKEEKKVSSDAVRNWSSFMIELDKGDIESTDEGPHIVLYSKNKKGEDINSNYVPIDLTSE